MDSAPSRSDTAMAMEDAEMTELIRLSADEFAEKKSSRRNESIAGLQECGRRGQTSIASRPLKARQSLESPVLRLARRSLLDGR